MQTPRVARQRLLRESRHQRFTDAAAPDGCRDDEVFEVEERPGAEGRARRLVEQRDPLDRAVHLRDERLQLLRVEDPGEKPRGLGVVGRAQLLEGRQLAVELDDARPVVAFGAPNRDAVIWR
jgi:hypothetical protein